MASAGASSKGRMLTILAPAIVFSSSQWHRWSSVFSLQLKLWCTQTKLKESIDDKSGRTVDHKDLEEEHTKLKRKQRDRYESFWNDPFITSKTEKFYATVYQLMTLFCWCLHRGLRCTTDPVQTEWVPILKFQRGSKVLLMYMWQCNGICAKNNTSLSYMVF